MRVRHLVAVCAALVVCACSTNVPDADTNAEPTLGSAGLDGASAVAQPGEGLSPDGVLPFEPPERDADSPRVFAHYFPPYPISFDNLDASEDYYTTHYLDPSGEGGVHESYGGLLRDRPLPRQPKSDDDWLQSDLEDEVRQAISAGIDGFSVDILTTQTNPNTAIATRSAALLAAAAAVDPSFAVMLMPDMSGGLGSLEPAQLADEMAQLASSPAAFRLDDGRLVVSPFRAESHSPQWWSDFDASMAQAHGISVALVPVFVDSTVDIGTYADVSYGMSSWGARNPGFNSSTDTGPESPVALANRAHSLGKIWMAPVAVQDARPSQSIFDEAFGTDNLRRMWDNARTTKSEWVQLVTWNDYSEGTAFAPSVEHGWSFLDISAYWMAWFRTGSPPPITRDAVYLTHRTQLVGAPTDESAPMTVRPGGTEPMDVVEALTFLTEPSVVTVDVAGVSTVCMVPAGVGVCNAPLQPGAISATVSSGGVRSFSVQSPFIVGNMPTMQNLNYFSVSSRR